MRPASNDHIVAEVTGLVHSIFKERGRDASFSAETSLAGIGLTSMDMVTLMLGIESSFDLMIPSEDLSPDNFYSVASISKMIQRLTGAPPLAKIA